VVQKSVAGEINWMTETKGREWEGTIAKNEAIKNWCARQLKRSEAFGPTAGSTRRTSIPTRQTSYKTSSNGGLTFIKSSSAHGSLVQANQSLITAKEMTLSDSQAASNRRKRADESEATAWRF
jgi:hypothetical protein